MALFSIAAFVIAIRETMEAALIVGILLSYLDQTNNHRFKKDVWIGTILAILLSIIGAVIFEAFLGGFEGDSEKLFEGIVMISAAVVLTWMIIWMFYNAKGLKYELENRTQLALSEEKKYALFSIAFIAVFREGIETVLFLAGIGATEDKRSVFTGGITGIFVAIIISILLFRGSIELNIKQFFSVTSVILIFFAAGLFSHGMHEFQELGWFGSETSFWNKHLWNSSGILNDSEGALGPLIRALFGYQDKPSIIELVSYAFYWVAIGVTFVRLKVESQLNPTSV